MSKVRAKGAEGNLRDAKKRKGRCKCYRVPSKNKGIFSKRPIAITL